MVAELSGEACSQVGHTQLVDQELGKLKGPLCQEAGARQPFFVFGEQLRIAMPDHRSA
jgi:hypothetical protein